jgi:head-tail adaptor
MPPIGSYRHVVTVQNPGGSVPDGDGGYVEGWIDAVPPTLNVSITPATTADLERTTAGTVAATATHIVRGRWHPQITTSSRLLFKGRALNVIFVGNPDERDTELVMICAEQLSGKVSGATGGTASAPVSQTAAPAWDNA